MANWDISHGHYTIDKQLQHRELVNSVVHWFLGRYCMNRKSQEHRVLHVNLKTYKTMKCWGECSEGENGIDYNIDIPICYWLFFAYVATYQCKITPLINHEIDFYCFV